MNNNEKSEMLVLADEYLKQAEIDFSHDVSIILDRGNYKDHFNCTYCLLEQGCLGTIKEKTEVSIRENNVIIKQTILSSQTQTLDPKEYSKKAVLASTIAEFTLSKNKVVLIKNSDIQTKTKNLKGETTGEIKERFSLTDFGNLSNRTIKTYDVEPDFSFLKGTKENKVLTLTLKATK